MKNEFLFEAKLKTMVKSKYLIKEYNFLGRNIREVIKQKKKKMIHFFTVKSRQDLKMKI